MPLTLIGYEAWENIRLAQPTKKYQWIANHKWPIYFFVSVVFWNLVGAGLFGFLINPPISLYYVQRLNLTPVHGHTALFGVYFYISSGARFRKGLAATAAVVNTVLLENPNRGRTAAPELGNRCGRLSGDFESRKHSIYVKGELPRLAVLAQKVLNRHGATQAELPAIQSKLAQFDEELTQHLAKEESILFPYVVLLERAAAYGSPKPGDASTLLPTQSPR